MLKKNNSIIVLGFLALLFVINILTHYIPFERIIISPDTFTFIGDKKYGLLNFLLRPDRPLEYIIHELEHFLLGYNFHLYFYYLLFSVFILTSTAYFFFSLLFNYKISFILTLIYIILPSKIEIYHSSIYAWINIVDSMYIASLAFFILFTQKKLKIYLVCSFFLYAFAILSRESGFFIPFILICYFYFFIKNKNLFDYFKYLFPYFFLILINLIYRFTGAFYYTKNTGREVLLENIPLGFFDFFNIFIGRYFIKNILNGLYQFLSFNFFVIFFLVIVNVFIIYFFKLNFSIAKIPNLKTRSLLFFILLIFFSVMPNIINGSFGGRSTIISSLGFCVLIIYVFKYFYNNHNKIIFFLLFFFLVVSQGNSLAQTISLRIPNSIYEFVSEKKNTINNYNNIIIDTKSFAENIPYTLLDLDSFDKFRLSYNNFNILNTYMGAQSLESWGLTAMLYQVLKNKKVNILITTETIITQNKQLNSAIYINAGYNNKFVRKEITANSEDTYVINYDNVYNNGYFNGNRNF